MGRRRRLFPVFLIIILAASIGAAGCGGDGDGDDSGATPAGPLTKERYVAAANELCLGYYDAARALSSQYGKLDTRDEALQFLRDVSKLLKEQRTDLAKLQPPAPMQARVKQMHAELALAQTSMDSWGGAVQKGKSGSALDRLEKRSDQAWDRADAHALKLGLRDCANSPEIDDE